MFWAAGLVLLIVFVFVGRKKPDLAMVISPLACVIFALCTFVTGDRGAMFVAEVMAPTIFVATLIAVTLSRSEPGQPLWPRTTAKCLLAGFSIVTFVLLIVVVLGNPPSAISLVPVALVTATIFVSAAISHRATARRAIAAYVVSTIGASIRQNLPLAMALDCAACDQGDERADILRAIQKWLVQGYLLSDAIRLGYPKCPSHVLAAIRAAERINQLPAAFSSIEADMAAKAEQSKKVQPVCPSYPIVLAVVLVTIVWGLMTFVMPQLHSVLQEVSDDAKLPAATRALMGVVGFVGYEHGLLFSLLLVFVVLVVLSAWIMARFRRRRPYDLHLSSRIGDFLKWHLPILHWFERNYSLVQTIEMLRHSLNAGCAINEAIANATYLDVNNRFKKNLQRWLDRVERGDNIGVAARDCGVGEPLAWAFDDKVNQGNTLSILEALESFYRSNYSYRVNLLRFVLWPGVTLMMASIVGFVVYAIYSAPIAIINHLAEVLYS